MKLFLQSVKIIVISLVFDLRKDFFEEISNDEEMHRLTGNSGCASEMLRKDCEMQVAPEYRAYLYPVFGYFNFEREIAE